MDGYLGAIYDDFFVSCRLFLRLDMALERETVLHFFDRVRKEYPRLRSLRRHESGGLILEEEPEEGGSRHWIRLDPGSLRFGIFAPTDMDDVRRFSEAVITQAPYYLAFSEIDFDHLEAVYGFDLQYDGNHDQLVAETLLADQAAAALFGSAQTAHVIEAQPYFGIALTPDCDLQAFVEVKSRTSTYEVRSETYESQPITVFLTLRQYFGQELEGNLETLLGRLFDRADDLATEQVVPAYVNPLAAAIASRS